MFSNEPTSLDLWIHFNTEAAEVPSHAIMLEKI